MAFLNWLVAAHEQVKELSSCPNIEPVVMKVSHNLQPMRDELFSNKQDMKMAKRITENWLFFVREN